MADLLLGRGASIDLADTYGENPRIKAGENGHAQVVQILLVKGASLDQPTSEEATPSLAAKAKGHNAVVRPLLQQGSVLESSRRSSVLKTHS